MRFYDLMTIVLRNLNRIRMRTALTTVGVIIGVAAIVTLLSIAFGFQRNMTEQMESMGDVKQITVMPPRGLRAMGIGMQRVSESEEEEKLLDDDVVEAIEKLEGVQAVVPTLSVREDIEMGRYETSLSITGIDSEKGENLQIAVIEGRFLRRKDTNVIVVGYNVPDIFREKGTSKGVEDLDLLGRNAEIVVTRENSEGEEETKSFKVKIVGIMAEQGTEADYSVYIPIELAAEIREWESEESDILEEEGYERLIVKAEEATIVNEVAEKITAMGYNTFTFKQIIDNLNQVFALVEIILVGIGAIALIVAALGIINTMLMSILERTREIGIMKVIGASNRDITQIFLVEASMIGLLGGLGGITLGYVVANVVDVLARVYVTEQGSSAQSFVFMPLWLVGFAIGFAMLTGLISGVYPARKAAGLSPVKALQHQ